MTTLEPTPDPVSQQTGEPEEVRPARRQWLRGASVRRAMLGVAWGVGLGALVPLGVLYPYWRDDRALDLVVKIVALDWRDFGEAAARTRLQYELDHRGIGLWVGDQDCGLDRTEADALEVRCGWAVDLAVPGTELVVPLAFSSRADVLPDGDVR